MWEPSYDYLEHHGIDGQKWGKRNGPPYPLDYKSHSAEEKRKNPKYKLSGNEKEDRKTVKSAFEKAKYARAASLETETEQKQSQKKFLKGKISKEAHEYNEETARLAKKKELEIDADFADIANAYIRNYGDTKLKSIDKEWGKLSSMTANQGRQYIYNHGSTSYYALAGMVGGTAKVLSNQRAYNSYKEDLRK